MIDAEELGITSKNVDEMLKSKDPKVQRLKATAKPWAWMKNSPTISSNRWAITAKFLNAMSALRLLSALNADLMLCGKMAA